MKTTAHTIRAVCDCCGSCDTVYIATKRNFAIRQCGSCGLIFVFPQPGHKDIAMLYSKTAGYFATANTDLSKTSPLNAENLNKILSANGIEKGSFLDVGCSTGELIYHMRRLGWRVAGTEINNGAVAVAWQHDLQVFCKELEKCRFQHNSFDAIYMGDVIEHLWSARQALLAAKRILRKAGLIIIKTMNAKCSFAVTSLMGARVFRLSWPYSEAPYHLYDFYPETLSQLVSSIGFEVISSECSGHIPFCYTVGGTGYFDDLKISMKESGKYQPNLRLLMNIPKLTIAASFILPFYAWGIISDKVKQTGSRITLIARKL